MRKKNKPARPHRVGRGGDAVDGHLGEMVDAADLPPEDEPEPRPRTDPAGALDATLRRAARRLAEKRRADQKIHKPEMPPEQASDLRRELLDLLNRRPNSMLPEDTKRAVLDFFDALLGTAGRGGAPEEVWRFVMVWVGSLAIWKAIRGLPAEKRPQDVTDAYYIAMLHLEPNTGVVKLTREQLAALMEKTPNAAGRAMGELVKLGVFEREYRKIPGLQGRGIAVWRVNPDVAWNGSLPMRSVRRATVRKRGGPAAAKAGV